MEGNSFYLKTVHLSWENAITAYFKMLKWRNCVRVRANEGPNAE